MKLTLAGPGAGKTTDMIQQILDNVDKLNNNRDMAIITYTNASVKDIKEKLTKVMYIQNNIFIGTIHSFLLQYFIRPHGHVLGYNTENISVVDKIDNTGMEWIDSWVKKNFYGADVIYRKKAIRQKQLNIRIDAAAKKGIFTYDGIVKISKDIASNKNCINLIANKIQFLFVDEYQDIDKYGHDIILALEKCKKTKISIVGDPDQSIYKFRYGQSQIGEQAPREGRQPILEVQSKKNCQINKLLINHRSSKEIVEFNNRYSTLDDQEPEHGSICKIHFLDTIDIQKMYTCMKQLGDIYKCNDYLVLSYQQENTNLIKQYDKNIDSKNTQIDLRKIIDCIVSATGTNKKDFYEKYNLDLLQLKRLASHVRKELEMKEFTSKDVLKSAKKKAEELYGIQIKYSDLKIIVDNEEKKCNFETNVCEEQSITESEVRYLTIHKSKGLEADCVLVLAENARQFFKWLNMTQEQMKNQKDEEYRLGYVAFTRPKRILILACLEKIDTSKLSKFVFDII